MRMTLGAVIVCAAAMAGTALGFQPNEPAPPAGGKPDASGQPTWMAIPLEGELGTDVSAAGVVAALNDAKNRKIGHAVFIIDSTGGKVEDARAIVESIKPYAAVIKFSCVVKRAGGAALWIVAASDNIFVSGKSEAMSFAFASDDEKAKAAQARAAGEYADELARLAESHGHSPLIFRAIVTPKSELWLTPGDKPGLSPSNPATENARQVDGPDSTLQLTPELAAELGLARSINDLSGDSVGPALGVAPWRSSKNVGAAHMKHAAAELSRLHKNFEASQKKFETAVDELNRRMERLPAMKEKAAADDPRKSVPLQYDYDQKGLRHLKADNYRMWREQTAKAMQDWTDIQGIIKEAESLRKEAVRQADISFRDAQTVLKYRRVPIAKDAKPPEVPQLNFDPKAEMRAADEAIAKLRREQVGP